MQWKKGFTMVELLVVLIILTILVAVAAPMYFANVDRSKASEAVAGMGLIRQAEREYYIRHKNYLAVTGNTTSVDPTLDIDVGATQYFSNKCYSVTVGNSTFTAGGPSVDFLIKADGSLSENLTSGRGAVNYSDVNLTRLEMDNSGTVKVSYKGGAAGSWKDY